MDEKKVREAIAEFNKQLLKYKGLLDCCSAEYERKPFERIIQYFEIAIEALEMQLPKKVLLDECGGYKCPNCGETEWYGHDLEYCHECGQRIAWSE